MKITLVRHSQTLCNLKYGYIGITDDPLCDVGIENAKNAEIFPDVKSVFTSGMKRTNQTAEIMFPNAVQIEIPELHEMDFGIFEGYSHEELEDNKEYISWLESMCEDPCPEGETKCDFAKRCAKAFTEVVEKEKAKGTEELYFMIHGGVMMAIVSELVRPARDYFDVHVKCCQSYVLILDEDDNNPDRPFTILGE